MTPQWKPFNQSAAAPSKPIGTLGVIAIALGVGVIGAYVLDAHGHTCEACGKRWWHLGAFNLGDPKAHTCASCGTVQWWKNGTPHVFRSVLRTPLPDPYAALRERFALNAPAPFKVP